MASTLPKGVLVQRGMEFCVLRVLPRHPDSDQYEMIADADMADLDRRFLRRVIPPRMNILLSGGRKSVAPDATRHG